MNILKILNEKGFDTIPQGFYSQIEKWKSWYDGNVKDFHNYQVFNGQKHVQCQRYTMGMAKKVAEDWANILLNEKVKITLEGKREQEFFDTILRENRFEVKGNEMQELKAALGTVAYVIRVTGMQVKGGTGTAAGGKIRIDYVTAPNIFPLSWENGQVMECAFTSTVVQAGKKYVYLQIHKMDEKENYVLENSIYEDQNGNLTEVPLRSVKRFESVAQRVETGSPRRVFIIDKLNIANNINNTLPMGIPAFANAIDQLKGVDVAYDSYVNEFILGKKRIMVQPGAAKDLNGNPTFDPNELTYYVLQEDIKDVNLIQPIDMTLRTQDHNAGLQDMLNALSSRCGFGENHYRFDNGSVATATQVISENSSMFRTIKKHEIILEAALKELCGIILHLGNRALNMGLDEEVEISIDFDDSIIEDKETEFNRVLRLAAAGLMKAEEARAILMNEDIDTAREALPGIEELTTEKQDEVE